VRRDVRVECSSDVTSCLEIWRKYLLKIAPLDLSDTKSPDYRDQHMGVNAWEGIGKELKIKHKFYVTSREVRIVCPRLMCIISNLQADMIRHLMLTVNIGDHTLQ
jgi:hypothetical protein